MACLELDCGGLLSELGSKTEDTLSVCDLGLLASLVTSQMDKTTTDSSGSKLQ